MTTGGKRDAEIATPINGPAAPSNNANATPVPDVNALCANLKYVAAERAENEYHHQSPTKRNERKKKRNDFKNYSHFNLFLSSSSS